VVRALAHRPAGTRQADFRRGIHPHDRRSVMNLLHLIGVAALLAAPAAFAGDMPKAQLGGYLVSEAIEAESDFGDSDDDGTGFGIRGWAGLPNGVFFGGEYQTVSMDEDLDQMRLGGGYSAEINPRLGWLARGEYVNLSDDGGNADQSGFGGHGGVYGMVNRFSWFVTGGLLVLEDGEAVEFNGGVAYAFIPALSGMVDFRSFSGTFEQPVIGDVDVVLADFRIGLSYNFH
jgi:hypothetical protein